MRLDDPPRVARVVPGISCSASKRPVTVFAASQACPVAATDGSLRGDPVVRPVDAAKNMPVRGRRRGPMDHRTAKTGRAVLREDSTVGPLIDARTESLTFVRAEDRELRLAGHRREVVDVPVAVTTVADSPVTGDAFEALPRPRARRRDLDPVERIAKRVDEGISRAESPRDRGAPERGANPRDRAPRCDGQRVWPPLAEHEGSPADHVAREDVRDGECLRARERDIRHVELRLPQLERVERREVERASLNADHFEPRRAHRLEEPGSERVEADRDEPHVLREVFVSSASSTHDGLFSDVVFGAVAA